MLTAICVSVLEAPEPTGSGYDAWTTLQTRYLGYFKPAHVVLRFFFTLRCHCLPKCNNFFFLLRQIEEVFHHPLLVSCEKAAPGSKLVNNDSLILPFLSLI